jgi:four helix bundle protein
MASIDMFEDLEVWKKARVIMNRVYDLSEKAGFARDFALRDQIRRACISTMSNISEGHERDGDKERVTFLSYAKGSAGEARSQIYVALDRKYISKDEFDSRYALLVEVSKMINGFMYYLKKSDYKGRKYLR